MEHVEQKDRTIVNLDLEAARRWKEKSILISLLPWIAENGFTDHDAVCARKGLVAMHVIHASDITVGYDANIGR